MQSLKMPHEISRFKPKIFKAFTTRQFICLVISSIISISSYMLLTDYFYNSITLTISVFLAVPIVVFGFVEIYGLAPEKYFKDLKKYMFQSRNRQIDSRNVYVEKLEQLEKLKNKKRKNGKQKFIKIKKDKKQ